MSMETGANPSTGASGWDRYPGLRRGPGSSKGKGRLIRGIRRCFMVLGPEVSSSQLYDWCYARKRRKLSQRHRHSVWRIVVEIADIVGCGLGPGHPHVWRLNGTGYGTEADSGK